MADAPSSSDRMKGPWRTKLCSSLSGNSVPVIGRSSASRSPAAPASPAVSAGATSYPRRLSTALSPPRRTTPSSAPTATSATSGPLSPATSPVARTTPSRITGTQLSSASSTPPPPVNFSTTATRSPCPISDRSSGRTATGLSSLLPPPAASASYPVALPDLISVIPTAAAFRWRCPHRMIKDDPLTKLTLSLPGSDPIDASYQQPERSSVPLTQPMPLYSPCSAEMSGEFLAAMQEMIRKEVRSYMSGLEQSGLMCTQAAAKPDRSAAVKQLGITKFAR